MKIWRITKLKEQLKGSVPVQLSLPYLIANTFIIALVAGLPNFGYNDPDMLEMGVALLHWILQAIVAAIGIRMCFRANGGSNGVAFFERLNALGFVLFVRFAVACVVVLLALIYTRVGRALIAPAWEVVYLILLALSTLYWWRLVSHIRSIGHAKEV